MIVIRDCCDNVSPVIRMDLLGRYLIYCPRCGYSIIGHTFDDVLQKWNDYQNGVEP